METFRQWPHSPNLDLMGDNPVETSVICVLTRFGLRRAFDLLPTYLDYRRVVNEARTTNTPGLLRAVFLVENPRTCYSLSVWANYDAIPHFGSNVLSHVTAGNRIFGRLARNKNGRPEIWSTKWQLATVSNNLSWDDFDLRSLLLVMLANQKEHS